MKNNNNETTLFDLWPFNLLIDIFYEPSVATRVYLPSIDVVLGTLPERERKVIELRYKDGMTLKAISESEEIGPERVRQIQSLALKKLRHPSRTTRMIAVSPDETACLNRRIRELVDKNPDAVFPPDLRKFSMDDPIESLDLSVRSYNSLHKRGIRTIRDLSKMTPEQLKKIRNLGAKSTDEIISKMALLGILTYEKPDRNTEGTT